MKIGILTFHDGINHGGYFQAYATFSFLRSHGYDVEIINYKNKKHFINEWKAFLLIKNPKILFKNIIKISKFIKAQKKFYLTKFTLNYADIDIKLYDVIIFGSDIIWNYEWDFLGHDPIYFGQYFKHVKLISYAPSCGAVNLNNPIPDYVRNGLKNFAHISVRDENTANMVRRAIDVNPKIVLDPTFIYDFQNEIVDAVDEPPYILVYAYTLQNGEIDSVISFAKDNNLKLISVGYTNAWCDKNIVSIGPYEWLAYFKNASFVLTSTFHGTIFSIKYNKNFAISNNEGINKKIKTILSRIELENRIIQNCDMKTIFSKKIDYNNVNKKLSVLIEESCNFLVNAIND